MIAKIVQDYIARNRLLCPASRVVVGLSGGADSVALLCLLLELGYDCWAVHCNFGLRGEESERDEHFVRALCQRKAVPLEVVRFDTRVYARKHRLSIEMAARKLRYDYFEKWRLQCHAAAIAVAHHRNDSVETLLLNLIRGTGIHGLRGIQPRNGQVVRPLLAVSRQMVVDYLESIGQDFVTDSTNLQDEYVRNKIRLNLLPQMREINPSILDTLAATAERLADVEAIYNRVMDEKRQRVLTLVRPGLARVDIPCFLRESEQPALLYELLAPYGFKPERVADIYASLRGKPGLRFYSSTHEVLRDRDCWLVYPLRAGTGPEEYGLHTENGSFRLPDGAGTLAWSCRPLTDDFEIPRADRSTACFDADKLAFPLVLRQWRQGDTFVPFGMCGRKKLSDYMTDRKFTRRQKEEQWLVCSAGRVLWLVGERTDNRFRIDASTRRVCTMKWDKEV